jgi:Asp-tRNA(Asn)/Glu-tRNA(Gln) amidotransferase C subunit
VIPGKGTGRADEVRPSLDRETVLRGAPQRQGPYFRVPSILGES